MNKSWWEGLSDSDQAIIKAAAAHENEMMMAEYNARNGAALTKLVNEQGVKLRQFNDDIYDSFGEASDEVFDEVRQHSDLANRVHESFAASRESVGAWAKISDQAYVAQRNRVLGL
jgi:TRAP-type mannitol/chloroaromatic compound transport system substrate-binding protein